MFTANLIEFQTQQIELHKQAENIRLVKSLQKHNAVISKFINAAGKMLVQTGQQLIASSRVAS
jgi:hypothetical protein